jgi:hypothetical protein
VNEKKIIPHIPVIDKCCERATPAVRALRTFGVAASHLRCSPNARPYWSAAVGICALAVVLVALLAPLLHWLLGWGPTAMMRALTQRESPVRFWR